MHFIVHGSKQAAHRQHWKFMFLSLKFISWTTSLPCNTHQHNYSITYFWLRDPYEPSFATGILGILGGGVDPIHICFCSFPSLLKLCNWPIWPWRHAGFSAAMAEEMSRISVSHHRFFHDVLFADLHFSNLHGNLWAPPQFPIEFLNAPLKN